MRLPLRDGSEAGASGSRSAAYALDASSEYAHMALQRYYDLHIAPGRGERRRYFETLVPPASRGALGTYSTMRAGLFLVQAMHTADL